MIHGHEPDDGRLGQGQHRHNHTPGSHHVHAPASFGSAFAVATILNVALVVAQVIFGLMANSIALLADAGHNFGDVLGLLLAWGAQVAARWHPTERFTYGFRSASILSALLNAVTLLVATGAIAWEAIGRLPNPGAVGGFTVMVVAGIGLLINGVSAWLLMGGRDDLNVRGAFLHLAADAAVSAGVVVAGAAILLTGWSWLDPVVSLAICAVIVWGTWGLLRESVRLSLGAVPSQVALADVRLYLEGLGGVRSVHDLHVWAMSTTQNALTAHLVMPDGHPGDAFIAEVSQELAHRFRIEHPTFQIELGDADACALAPAHIV
jgi:cobalt-zinc-cadmium efflux system protein